MTDNEIREQYQREGGPLGKNDEAITKFIDMLRIHEKSDNADIRTIVANLDNLKNLVPNFTIFQSEDSTYFMNQFSALQISTQSDQLALSHEFGHMILGKINKLEMPSDFEEVVKRARAHCVAPENKEKFIEYIEYLSDSSKNERTEAEKGPVSDIISSIFQYPALTFKKTNKTHILPSFHNRDYYFDEERGKMKSNKIFDEDFANFYALVSNNCHKELETLKVLLGEEWLKTMQIELERSAKTIDIIQEKPSTQATEQIKRTIIGVRESDIPQKNKEEKEKSEIGRRFIR